MTKLRQEPIPETNLAPLSLDPKLFEPYLGGLQQLFSQFKPTADAARAASFTAALDGQPSLELRKLYTLHDLRQTGTYFTGSELSTRILASVAAEIPLFERIIDPSCGAGDLLVGAARHLPLKSSLLPTLNLWGQYLVGFDINPSFVATTRVRLALLAMQRLNTGSSPARSINTLGVLSQATLSLIDHDKRRAIRVDLNRTIEQTLKTFSPFLKGRDIEIELELADGRPLVKGSEAAIESIVANLINNSVAAFEAAGTNKRRLKVQTITSPDDVLLAISDNGPGIVGVQDKDIWSPGITTRPHGTGLGLTIVRDTVTDLGGSVDAKRKGELGGASIFIQLPLTSR